MQHANSTGPSFFSSPTSNWSHDYISGNNTASHILFPSYNEVGYFEPAVYQAPLESLYSSSSSTTSTTSKSSLVPVSMSECPDRVRHAEDDSVVQPQPSRHVDYLSHIWREEDIWVSWKLIVSKRHAYENSVRLENASWRAWKQLKDKLKTVSPESLNWLKDSDVTWLYGPLQTGSDKLLQRQSASSSTRSPISKSHFTLRKKSILKKQSMSETILQRSLLSSSLLQRATAAIQAQRSFMFDHPYARWPGNFPAAVASRSPSAHYTSRLSSVSSSEMQSPCPQRRNIHFNEEVEQCIALSVKGADSSANIGRKTIAPLPSTTLKDVKDITEAHETTTVCSNGFCNGSLSHPSWCQEAQNPPALNPPAMTAPEDSGESNEIDWQPWNWQPWNFRGGRDDVVSDQVWSQNSHVSILSSPGGGQVGKPGIGTQVSVQYEGGRDAREPAGLFGKAVDTVNTAKDIAYVIWNVGWR